MFNELNNLDIDTCSQAEAKALVRAILPFFVKALQRVLSDDTDSQTSPCNNCNEYENCPGVCEKLEKELPGVTAGSYLLNKTCGDLMGKLSCAENSAKDRSKTLRTIEIPAPDAIFNLYEQCQHELTIPQWNCVYMKYKLGMRNVEIAKQTSNKQSSVCDMLKRAREKMENYYKNRNT